MRPLSEIVSRTANVAQGIVDHWQFATIPEAHQEHIRTDAALGPAVLRRIVARIGTVAEDKYLSDVGRKEKTEAIMAEEARHMDRILEGFEKRKTEYSSFREKVAGGEVMWDGTGWKSGRQPAAPGDEVTLREIRDRLFGLTPAERDLRYTAAVREGNDPQLVRAIETSPRSFPLVSTRATSEVRATRLAAAPPVQEAEHALLHHDALISTFRNAMDEIKGSF